MAQTRRQHSICRSNLRYAYGVKREDGQAHTSSLQLMVKLALFRCHMDPLNSVQQLSNLTTEMTVPTLCRIPQGTLRKTYPQEIPRKMLQKTTTMSMSQMATMILI